jgi:putative flavoprotein involved in K+ transport
MASHDVVVIGAGQAGLSISALLSRRGIEHLVLEREAIGSRWRHRWDSFTLVTPNWQIRLPGAEYAGPEPDGFLPRDEIVAHLESYARASDAPIRVGVDVSEITRDDDMFLLRTNDGPLTARAVVVATGAWQRPVRPPLGELAPGILELHSHDYRNADSLPPGGVLVVGTGQSGAQIAEELREAGREVTLSVSAAGRLPRRYRGADIMRWAERIGFYERRADALERPADRFTANPHLSGKRGGHTINVHRFAHDGVRLAGKLVAIDGSRVTFADDLARNLAASDAVSIGFRQAIEDAIREGRAIDEGSPDDVDEYDGLDGFAQPGIDGLDLHDAGIGTLLWTSGFRWDYSWVRPAPLDGMGYPIQHQGVTDVPGLAFLGLHFMDTYKSGLLIGVGEDAAHVADHIADHLGAVTPA